MPKEAFARLSLPTGAGEPPRPSIDQAVSTEVWAHLQTAGYLDASGTVLGAFNPTAEGFELDVPAGLEPIRAEITDAISKFVFAGLGADALVDQRDYETALPNLLPDILADLQNGTDLTRSTLVKTLRQSGRLADFTVNPQAFIALATTRINAAMRSQMVDGLLYEAIPGLSWEMHRLEAEASQEIEHYAARLYQVQHDAKTPFDHVVIDSEVERRFAKGLDDNHNVKFFIKLPAWFTVDTPIGTYNPDWAVVFDDTERVYLVRETKGTLDAEQRRHEENVKIDCARRHFAAIGVDYDVATSVSGMISGLSSSGATSL